MEKKSMKESHREEEILPEKMSPEVVNQGIQEIKETASEEAGEEGGKREKDVEAALKDPSVQSFMETFKAQVLSVKPMKKAEKKE
jgi:hypothetical protein